MEWNLELEGARAIALALAILSGLLLLVILIGARWTRRSQSQLTSSEAIELHAAMLRVHGELPQLLQNVHSRLDAKMMSLRSLIREATGTIDELRRLKALPPNRSDANVERPAAVVEDPCDSEPLNASATTTPPPKLAKGARMESVPCHSDESPAPDAAELRAQRYAHVYSLADAGLDSADISAETGMHRGEVELVLNLRRKRIRVDSGSRAEPAHVIHSPEEAPV